MELDHMAMMEKWQQERTIALTASETTVVVNRIENLLLDIECSCHEMEITPKEINAKYMARYKTELNVYYHYSVVDILLHYPNKFRRVRRGRWRLAYEDDPKMQPLPSPRNKRTNSDFWRLYNCVYPNPLDVDLTDSDLEFSTDPTCVAAQANMNNNQTAAPVVQSFPGSLQGNLHSVAAGSFGHPGSMYSTGTGNFELPGNPVTVAIPKPCMLELSNTVQANSDEHETRALVDPSPRRDLQSEVDLSAIAVRVNLGDYVVSDPVATRRRRMSSPLLELPNAAPDNPCEDAMMALVTRRRRRCRYDAALVDTTRSRMFVPAQRHDAAYSHDAAQHYDATQRPEIANLDLG